MIRLQSITRIPTRTRATLSLLYRQERIAIVGLAMIAAIGLIGALAPTITGTVDPFRLYDILRPPSSAYPMGTDHLGRNIFYLVVWGSRTSLLFGLGAAAASLLIGIVLGAIPGYFGGLIDDVFSRFFEIFLMIPPLFLILVIVALFGTNIYYTMIVVALTIWPSNARITRAQVLSLKSSFYVKAAIGSGANTFRVIFRHILPNGIFPVIANCTLQIGYAILEASLSFLGLGDMNVADWGQVLEAARVHYTAWWMVVFPGTFLAMLVFGVNALGDGINTLFRPKSR
jgi:peptide/nickel transport system permease protein